MIVADHDYVTHKYKLHKLKEVSLYHKALGG